MTCDPNPITTPILLAIALPFTAALALLIALKLFIDLCIYAGRPENARPFREQWYRGCGWFPSSGRGPLHDVSTATKGE